MAEHGFVDRKGKPLPSFEQGINKHGFEQYVANLLEESRWIAIGGGKYEDHMLRQAEQFMIKNPSAVDLSKLITGKFPFSGSFVAPAFHWFLTWGTPRINSANLVKHPTVTENVLNALDDKGNSALFYCHREHYQAGWMFNQPGMLMLLEDPRFVALDFPVIPAYGGGVTPLNLHTKLVEAVLKRNIGLNGSRGAKKLQQTVNSTRDGVSMLHMACDEILVQGVAPPSLIRLIRSHPEFQAINHIAEPDERGGAGNTRAHHIRKESCVAAALRKDYSKKRAKVVEAVLERHPSKNKSRDFRLKPDRSLAGMAQESLDAGEPRKGMSKDNGWRARILSFMARRAVEDADVGGPRRTMKTARGARSMLKRPAGSPSVMKTIAKPKRKGKANTKAK